MNEINVMLEYLNLCERPLMGDEPQALSTKDVIRALRTLALQIERNTNEINKLNQRLTYLEIHGRVLWEDQGAS